MGTAMAKFLPSKGRIGRIINPGPVSFTEQHRAQCILTVLSSTRKSTLPYA
jgi:hypothetical protein